MVNIELENILKIIKDNPEITGRQIAKRLKVNEQYIYGYLDCLSDNKIIIKNRKYKTIANYELPQYTNWIMGGNKWNL